jgi:hypothetical protein
MSGIVTATNPGTGIVLTLYAKDGAVVTQMKLSWRRAALLGSDLVTLAINESQTEAQQIRSDKVDSRR